MHRFGLELSITFKIKAFWDEQMDVFFKLRRDCKDREFALLPRLINNLHVDHF